MSAKRAQDLLVNGFNMEGFGLAGISGGPLILRATEEQVGVICGKEIIWLKALRSELAEALLPRPPAPPAEAQRPYASFTVDPTQADEPLIYDTLTFDASASQDPDGRIVRYDWDFGDGSTASTPEPYTEHAYTQFGSFTVTLTVTDSSGLTASARQTLLFRPPPTPRIVITPPEVLTQGLWFTSPDEVRSFTVANGGEEPLEVELSLDDPDFAVWPQSFTLKSGLTQEIQVVTN